MKLIRTEKIVYIIVFIIAFCLSGIAQTNLDSSTTVKTDISQFAVEGKVSGEIPEYAFFRNNYNYLMSLKRPNLRLNFDSGAKVDLENYRELVEILDDHWEKLLEFNYSSQTRKTSNSLIQADISSEWSELNEGSTNELQAVFIETPDGKRKISKNETAEVLAYLNKTASALISRGLQTKAEFTPLKILKKSSPSFRNCRSISAEITLRVTFDKSARVTNIEILSPSGCESFDRSSVRVAKKIKFTPAQYAGEPVTVKKKIIYSGRIVSNRKIK